MMSHQDWNTVVLTKSRPSTTGKGSKDKKNKKAPVGPSKAKRAEDENEDFRTAKVGKNFSRALQKARLQKGWKQQQLAQQLNVRVTVINQYESGIYLQIVINK